MKKIAILAAFLITVSSACFSQADNEIQVYASPTIDPGWTIFELHSNYTFKGSKYLIDPNQAHWVNETLEITHGFAKNLEVGIYLFTGFDPGGNYVYLGNQIRPRITAPEEWNLPFGLSLSAEFGFFRPDRNSSYFWQGEIRPIFDKTVQNFYFSFNPNIGFAFNNGMSEWDIAPQIKAVYTIMQKFGLGFEYYTNLGSFNIILPWNQEEHLLGPMFDLYTNPNWELNAGFLVGLTDNSNQSVVKVLVGRRMGWGKQP